MLSFDKLLSALKISVSGRSSGRFCMLVLRVLIIRDRQSGVTLAYPEPLP